MSNLAVKILYNRINSIDSVYCERVFAPAPDLEIILRKNKIPIFSLENKKPLKDFDLLCFTLGYELTITNLLNILDLSGISLLKNERSESDPVIIAGGPAVANTAPFEDFIDFFFIGESEEWFSEVFPELVKLKKNNAGRGKFSAYLNSLSNISSKYKKDVTPKRIWQNFSNTEADNLFPVPNIKTVQDHGVIEIMRGCPNGCRFCYAGYLYRPYRIKDFKTIIKEADNLILKAGYREITLSSLSSGDYKNLNELINYLNKKYQNLHVSFALPSLRVNSFTLNVLKEISYIRKSGLTFAVETPEPDWQKKLNKVVTLFKTINILKEAKKLGWKKAKFYFMVGLPVSEKDSSLTEEELIVDFLIKVKEETGMYLSVNTASFIPKPHTPFEHCRQLTEDEALSKIMFIKRSLKKYGIKVSYHAPFTSVLEGIVARGDKRTGKLILEAFKKGARLEAWHEYINRDVWREVINNAGWDVLNETLSEKNKNDNIHWNNISIGVTTDFFNNEYKKSVQNKLSPNCTPNCRYNCGICNEIIKVIENDTSKETLSDNRIIVFDKSKPETILIQFLKEDTAIFCSHLDTISIFERTILRAGYYARFSEGFNPKPLIKFAHPLSLGIISNCEIATAEIYNFDNNFLEKMNMSFPHGFKIVKYKKISKKEESSDKKKPSLMSLYWGSDYFIQGENIQLLKQSIEKNRTSLKEGLFSLKNVSLEGYSKNGLRLRIRNTGRKDSNVLKIIEFCTDIPSYNFDITRTNTWATSTDTAMVSYFERY